VGGKAVFHPYKFASRRYKKEDTIINIKNIQIGGETIQIAAGPCAVENRESIMTAAIDLKARGINILRAGAFKPRTNPYTFRGLGEEGLKFLKEAADAAHMKF
jgi:3-deoxy-7-phosphoheptulonate synthase